MFTAFKEFTDCPVGEAEIPTHTYTHIYTYICTYAYSHTYTYIINTYVCNTYNTKEVDACLMEVQVINCEGRGLQIQDEDSNR